MTRRRSLQNLLIGALAVLFTGARFIPGHATPGPVMARAISLVTGTRSPGDSARVARLLATETATALDSLADAVRRLSDPQALGDAFRSYFAFRQAHPDEVKKPYLYFVDYGLPSTIPRGYVFDMDALEVVDGPFAVAHGRGSSSSRYGVPTRFSNAPGSEATSLGLYLAQETYRFHGRSNGHLYRSIGLRLEGVSGDYNDNARERRVVAHGAPYVSATRAGRSEGCPAMELSRASRLLPKLADGGMVFLFAPDSDWIAGDPWLDAGAG